MSDLEIPPHAIDAEACVLGSALIEESAARWVFQAITARVFYKHDHRIIFEAMLRVWKRDDVVDPVLTVEEIKRTGSIGEVGGPTYIVGLTEKVSTAAHVRHYGNLVLRAYYDRQLRKAAYELHEEGKREESIDKIVRLCRARDLTEARGGVTIREACHQVIDELQEGPADMIKLGLASIDGVSGGHEKGDLVTLGARTRVGKTAVLLASALNLAKQEKCVAYFAGEMSATQVTKRAIAARSGVEHWRVRARKVEKNQWASLTNAAGQLSELPIHFCSIPSPSLRDIRAFADSVRADVVIVDYLTRCNLPKAETMRVRVNEFMKGLKNFARETSRLVLLAAQISRLIDKAEDKRPTLSDLKESGTIEEESDVVILLHCTKANIETNGVVPLEAAVAKNRHGPCGGADLTFDKPHMNVTSQGQDQEAEEKHEQPSFI